MVVNVTLQKEAKCSGYELLAWLNQVLQTRFDKVEHTHSGAAYCQLMDLLSPGSVDLNEVKFKAEENWDVLLNYKLLEDAFRKTKIKKPLPVKRLVQGTFQETFDLLRWFKQFFDRNFTDQKYNALEARGGQSLLPSALTHLDVSKEGFSSCVPKETNQAGIHASISVTSGALDLCVCNPATLQFISKYCPGVSDNSGSMPSYSTARHALGQRFPDDIKATCSQTPYCLYIYSGVELGEEEIAYVVLIGHFDQGEGLRCVRLLNVIHPEKKAEGFNLDFVTLLDMLKKFEIPLRNLVAFYTNDTDLKQSQALVSGLKSLNPEMVSLCGLEGIVDRACNAGIVATGLSDQVNELIWKIYCHYTSCPVTSACLVELFSGMEMPSVTGQKVSLHSLSLHKCVPLRTMLLRIAGAWSELAEHFGMLHGSDDGKLICSLLGDQCLRLIFLFLSDALQPLCLLQETLDGASELFQPLQDARCLVHSCLSAFLQPNAVERYLRRGSVSLLKNKAEHLPKAKVGVGPKVEEFLSEYCKELSDCLQPFYESAVSFYAAVVTSMTENLPLPDLGVMNMSVILNPTAKLEVTGKMVTNLGQQLGICNNQERLTQLTDEFLEYQLSEEPRPSSCQLPLEQHWKVELRIMEKTSVFRKLILTLLALPRTLDRDLIFAQVFGKPAEKDITETRTRNLAQDDDITDSGSYKSAPSHPLSPLTQHSASSDLVDLKEVEDVAPMETNDSPSEFNCIETPELSKLTVKHDDEDDITQTSYTEVTENGTSTPKTIGDIAKCKDGEVFAAGELVWGQVEGFAIWPGMVQSWTSPKASGSMRKVVWFGDGMFSEISVKGLLPFSAFSQCFCNISFATQPTYKAAVFHSLQVAAGRCGKLLPLETDCRDEQLQVLLDWAFGGFGPAGLRPPADRDESHDMEFVSNRAIKRSQKVIKERQDSLSSLQTSFKSAVDACRLLQLKKVSVRLTKLPLNLENCTTWKVQNLVSDDVKKFKKCSPTGENRPVHKKKHGTKNKGQIVEQSVNVDQHQHLHFNREQMVHDVLVNGKNIEDFCLSCGTAQIEIIHPLFEGSLCLKCKDNFMETLYRYDEDGYQSYCTVCCAGLEVILCGNDSCCRSYCVDCLNVLVGGGTCEGLKDVDPWICYLCEPQSGRGALRPRTDWRIRVQEFFANNSAMEFEPHRVYPSIPANLRRPIRVLSLFDGISTGYLVLRDLGFKVEKYVASEIDEDSVTVSMVNHDGKIIQVDDVRFITKEHVQRWGPFDLLIGGSPCNDLSIVNPARKGLFEGSGRLFFDFYRLLNILKPKEGESRPFFWLFENVVFMRNRDKADICRFLECNPVLIDAVKVSPAHRARYFWGNLPGMNRPIIASQNDRVSLQACLDPGRVAKFTKVRTITTRTNSLKQGNKELFAVTMNGKDDNLWVTELEKIFGFPKHYTDVRNMGRMQRQKVLGKSWSVPVIRHLFAPLKDYFACDEVILK